MAKVKKSPELIIANKELAFQNREKRKRATELIIANKELVFQNREKRKRAAELIIANKELAFQNKEKKKRAAELGIANIKLAFQNQEKEKRAEELITANKELAFQNKEKEKRAEELSIANSELVFQNKEKEKRAAELIVANKELVFQNEEKEKRAEELIIANKELAFQNEEKEKRASEKEKRAEELIIANKELAFQNKEKEKRAAELGIANIELAFQNEEKEKRAAELGIANKELAFQNEEKEKRAAELGIANKELVFQNNEKEKRAAELGIANKELIFQNAEKEKRAEELSIAYKKLQQAGEELQMQEVLQLSEKSFRQLADLMPQIVWTATKDGVIDYYNKQWFEYTGFEEGHSHQSWSAILHADDVAQWQETLNYSIKTANTFQIEFRFKDRNHAGIYCWFLCRSLPVKDTEGNITKWIGTCTDINDAKRIQEKLQETEQRREDFIKMASHELKTPITSIKGYVQLLLMLLKEEQETPLPLQIKTSLIRIDKLVLRVTRLISEMLDLSRIETGRLELQNELFNLNDLITGAVEDILYTNPKNPIDISHDFSCNIYGDRGRIEQVIINLLTNAIKYSTGDSKIEVWIRMAEKNKVAVSVKDYGIGIDQKEHQNIFERFYRVEGKVEKTHPGFGIGLFIANEIIERHNSTITIESEKGKGSVFTFNLAVAAEI